MIILPFPELEQKYANDIQEWLDKYIPNPPLCEPQRWGLVCDTEGIELLIRICFANEKDATMFALKWL